MTVRRALAAAALACACALAPAGAQAQEPRVTVRGRGAVQAAAGGSATAVFRGENGGTRPVAAPADVRLPAGWTLAAPAETPTIAAGGATVWLLPFRVPAGTPAGRYAVRLATVGGAADSVVVSVAASRALAAEVAEAPRFVAAGDSIAVRVRVRNAGNVAETVRVAVSSPASSGGAAGRPASPAPASPPLMLAPGAEGEVAVRLATDAGARAVARRRVVARASAAGEGAPHAVAEAVVEVVPRTAAEARRHRLPAEVRVRVNGASGDVVPSVAGSGTLARGGGATVDFLLRGPEAPSAHSRPDEYRVSLATPRFDVRLGDQAYGLTPLTAPATFGFGGEAAARLGPLTARGYAVGDRRGDRAMESGAALEMDLGRRGMLGGGVLLPREGGPVATGRTRLTAGAFATLDAELAGGVDGGGAAHAVSLQGAVPGIAYHLRHQAADGDFDGAARGVESAEGRVSLALPGRAYLTGEAVRRASSPFAAGGERSLWERRVRAGVGGVFAAEARATEQEDVRRGSWDARAVRVSATARLGAATLTPSVEVGTGEGADGEAHPFRRASAQAAVDSRRLSLGASVDVLEGRANVHDAEGTTVSGSLRATARPLAGTVVRAEVRRSRRGDDGRDARYADVSVDQHVARGHRLVGRVQVVDDGFGDAMEPVVTLDYVVPVGVPLRRDGATGAASGRLFDAASGRPLAGVLIRVGDRSAVTDANGRWAVAGLAPGTHAVELDRLSLGAGLVPASPAAPSAEVRGRGTARVDVGVVRAGRISGRVLRADSAAAARGEAGVPLPAAVVVLAGPGEEVRRRVDEEGRFDLPGLRPGTWSARLDGDLPAHHRADPASATVELAPGAAAEVTLRVVPVARPLVFVDGGTVTAGAERPRRPPTTIAAAPRPASPAVPPPARPAPTPARRPDAERPAAVAAVPRPEPSRPPAAARPASPPPARPAVPEMPAEYAAMYRESLAVHERYEVQEGDAGLFAIALFVYNDGALWPKLWLANVDLLADPDDLAPGMVLRIPPKAPLTAAERAAVAARAGTRRR